MRSLALNPFCESHISSYMMAILDLYKAFIILGLDARKINSKRPIYWIALVMSSLERLRLLDWIYRMPIIFRYNFDWSRREGVTSLWLMPLIDLRYHSMVLRLLDTRTFLVAIEIPPVHSWI